MSAQLILDRKGHLGEAYKETIIVGPGSTLTFDENGNAISNAGGSGGGGGSGEFYFDEDEDGFTDPNDNVKAQRPAVCYSKRGGLWLKMNEGNNNTGWEERIAPGE